MDCYKFEENITKFIDNELKQDFRKLFLDHRDSCKQCSKKMVRINNNILTFNQLSDLKTSDNFLDGLNQKIYDYNNNPSIWQKIKSFKLFETPPVYVMGYVAALLLGIFSSYSLINMDTTNYQELNNKVTASLKEKSDQNIPSTVVDENYGIDQAKLADANNTPSRQVQQYKKPRITKNQKSFNQPIMPVSNKNNTNERNNFNQRINILKENKLSSESIDNIQNSMINNLNQNKEDYIVDYEKKNKYFQKRKDSLKNMLSKNLNKNIAAQIQEQIKKDSLEELEYYRSFDKIQRINE
jgi:hypothetical protein